jgi:hypothetical protein
MSGADTAVTYQPVLEEIPFKVIVELPGIVDFVVIDWGLVSEQQDTLPVTSETFAETLDVVHTFPTEGEKLVRATAFITNSTIQISDEITVHAVMESALTVTVTSPVMTTDSAIVRSDLHGIGGTASSPYGITSVSVTIDTVAVAVLGTASWSFATGELTPGQWNTVHIAVQDAQGTVANKTIYLFLKPDLEPATQISVRDSLCSSIELSWNKMAYCTSYLLYRSGLDSDIPDTVISISDTTCIDSGLNTGTSCTYKLRGWYSIPGTNSTDTSIASANITASTVQCFQKTYGGMADDSAVGVVVTPDSHYVIVGTSMSSRPGFSEIYAVRIDAKGDTVWTSGIGGSQNNVAVSARLAGSNEIIVGSGFSSASAGYSDVASLVGFSMATGLKTFENRILERYNQHSAFDAMRTSDNGLAFASFSRPPDGLYSDVPVDTASYVYRLSSTGDSLWQTYLSFVNEKSIAVSIAEGDNGSLYATGTSWTALQNPGGPQPAPNCFIAKISSAGDSLWSRSYGESQISTSGACIRKTSDNGFIVTGETAPTGVSGNVYILKITSAGGEQWSGSFGGDGREFGCQVIECADGGFAVAGGRWNAAQTDCDAYIVKFDQSGTVEWNSAFGGTGFDCFRGISQTTDGGFICAGQTGSTGAGNRDMFVVKTDRLGRSVKE